MQDLLQTATERANSWLQSNFIDEQSKGEVKAMLEAADKNPLIDAFYKTLEFGTGGLRGIMGVGSNCMNKYTLGTATQGLCNYLKKSFPTEEIHVAIAHDSRNNSRYFAETCAEIFSANDIHAHLFFELRPTPLLSYAVRQLKCQAGVVITASHNPKEYNGYKVYWNDGAQLLAPHDKNVIKEVEQIKDFNEVNFNGNPALIHSINKEVDERYYDEILKLANPDLNRKSNLKIAYTSLHGTGGSMVPECLKRVGFEHIHVVEAQHQPDGNFPTVHSPNPEEQKAMAMVTELGVKTAADIIMGTDPDADRVGIGVKDHTGNFILFNGNQALCLLFWFLLKRRKAQWQLPANAYVAKTIVTSELADSIAHKYGVTCYNTLTGFKYIASLMREKEGKESFITAGEESYGYMVGDFVRDKDAVSACVFFAEMAAAAKIENKTLYDWLIDMYVECGFYKESLINVVRKGASGEQEIKAMMMNFRNNPPQSIAGEKVIRMLDYENQLDKDLENGHSSKIDLPKSNVLQFYTAAGSKISVRPSGTEPKIKFYISVNTSLESTDEYTAKSAQLNQQIKAIEADIMNR
ncbi:MAG TPA: phospho-sugar mutase [Cyclobacteriaceae bacterium]|nr:phospho-sugar mutase [Cyclobacteriaceae bacterium]